MTTQPPNSGELLPYERYDYERLKRLEVKGIEEYRQMRDSTPLTTEAVLAFINQLSPWNLKTTGVFALNAYILAEVLKVLHASIQTPVPLNPTRTGQYVVLDEVERMFTALFGGKT